MNNTNLIDPNDNETQNSEYQKELGESAQASDEENFDQEYQLENESQSDDSAPAAASDISSDLETQSDAIYPVGGNDTMEIKASDSSSSQSDDSASDNEKDIPDNNQSDNSDGISSQSDEKATVAKPSSRKKAVSNTQRQRKAAIVTIDEHRTVQTDADKARNDLIDLLESMKVGRILSGTIQGVERSEENHSSSYAVIYHGDFKIIIPAEEAVEAPEDYRGRLPEDVYHDMITKRLGAEVDYIVKGIDPKSGIAAASRIDAMRAKIKEYYFGTDRDGNNILYPGVCAEARIVSVIRAGIFVDVFGLEIYIPIRELSYQRLMDASGYFQPGQRVLVKIIDIDRSDRNHVKAIASVKQAGENPYEKALRRYSVGNRYVGTVSMVDTNGVFVALDGGGIDCLCAYPQRGRPPRGSRVTVRILGINHEANRIWGTITHIAAPR